MEAFCTIVRFALPIRDRGDYTPRGQRPRWIVTVEASYKKRNLGGWPPLRFLILYVSNLEIVPNKKKKRNLVGGCAPPVSNSTAMRIPPGQNLKTRPRDYQKWIRSVRFTPKGFEKKELG